MRFIRINQFFLDIQTHRFIDSEQSSPMEPKQYALLRMFCNNPQKVLSMEAIKKSVWRGKFVDDSVVLETIQGLKFLLKDDMTSYQIIKPHNDGGFELVANIDWFTSIADAHVAEKNQKKQHKYSKILKLQMALIVSLAIALLVILYMR